jgi:hypothetical protein
MSSIDQAPAASAPAAVSRRRGPRRRPWTLAIAAGALACTAAVAIAVLTGVDDVSLAPPPATAKAALERAASAAEEQPEPPLAVGEYVYVRERSAYLGTTAGDAAAGWSVLAPSERETWTNRDGGGRIVVHPSTGRPTFPGPRDRERWEAAGRPDLNPGPSRGAHVMRMPAHGYTTGSRQISYEQLSALPSDGEAMYRKLVELAADAGPSPDQEAFTIIGDLLRSGPVPAHVRAGLYRAAGHIKGVRYAGAARDELGRAGLAVELRESETVRRLVFDPDTSQLLVEQERLLRRQPYVDADPGFVTGYRLVLENGVVKSDHARP